MFLKQLKMTEEMSTGFYPTVSRGFGVSRVSFEGMTIFQDLGRQAGMICEGKSLFPTCRRGGNKPCQESEIWG